jgi:hypothetical protein
MLTPRVTMPAFVTRPYGGWLRRTVLCIKVKYPVLYVPQATEICGRWLIELEKARWRNPRNREREMPKQMREKEQKDWKEFKDDAEAWAKDVGYWHFKRQYDQYNMANVTAKDPSAKFKKLRDKLGRELK